jgi:hypothetical protein
MRHIVLICLLALLAVTAYAQVISPQNTQVIYPSRLTAGVGEAIFFQQFTATNQPITNPTCIGLQCPFSLKLTNGPPGYQGKYSLTNANCYTNNNNSFSISINTQIAGVYTIEALYGTEVITSSIKDISTVPNVMSAQFSSMSGPGLDVAFVGENSIFTIQAVDQYGNNITNCSSITQTGFDIQLYQATFGALTTGVVGPCVQGQLNVTYVVDLTGNWILSAKYNGLSINNSLIPVLAQPGPPVATSCNVSGPGMLTTPAGDSTWFSFFCHDAFGNLVTYCTPDYYNQWTPQFNALIPPYSFNATYAGCDDVTGVLNYTYQQTTAANYTSNVYFGGNQSNHLPTFFPTITPGAPDPNQTIANGNGVRDTQKNVAGQVIQFFIDESDSFGNPIPGCIVANWNITISPPPNVTAQTPYCDAATDSLTSNYTTTVAGPYTVEIYLNNTLINNNVPYDAVVYSNLLVPTGATATFTNKMTAGSVGTITMTGFDQYGNVFNNCDLYSGSDDPFSGWSVSLVSNNNSNVVGSGSINYCNGETFYGNFTTTVAGDYNLTISYNGVQISSLASGPVIVNSGSIVITQSTAIGQGFTTQYNDSIIAGELGQFSILSFDQYGNQISHCISFDFYWNVEFVNSNDQTIETRTSTILDCNATGAYHVQFNITETGPFKINVGTNYTSTNPMLIINNLVNDTGLIQISHAAFNPAFSSVFSSLNGSVGQNFSVDAYVYDIFNNSFDSNSLNLTFVGVAANVSQNVNGTLSYVSDNLYHGYFTPTIEGDYVITVYSNGDIPVGNTALSTAFYGSFSSNQSLVNGSAFYQNVVAGTLGYIDVTTYNEYGYAIPASIVPLEAFNVTFQAVNGTYYSNSPVYDNTVYTNAVQITFNATFATNYTVTVSFNGSKVPGEDLTIVVAGPLDPHTLTIRGLVESSQGTGNFTVTGTDAFDNSVDLGANVQPSFEPACSHSNVSCLPDPVGDQLNCDFTAYFAGTYCVEIYYAPSQTTYTTPNSTIVVGGAGCSDSCNNQGYCFPQGIDNISNSTTGDCYCFQGYTGDDCSVKISKKYWNLWLGVGLIVGVPIILAIIGFIVGCLIGRR